MRDIALCMADLDAISAGALRDAVGDTRLCAPRWSGDGASPYTGDLARTFDEQYSIGPLRAEDLTVERRIPVFVWDAERRFAWGSAPNSASIDHRECAWSIPCIARRPALRHHQCSAGSGSPHHPVRHTDASTHVDWSRPPSVDGQGSTCESPTPAGRPVRRALAAMSEVMTRMEYAPESASKRKSCHGDSHGR